MTDSGNTVVGFIPLLDCAPLVVAAEKGFAAQAGIDLTLVRETSWANIRDRVVVGQFDAAHMLGPMAVASTLGIGHVKVPLIAPCSLGLGGNAITVSTALWEQMTQHGAEPAANPKVQGEALRRVVRIRDEASKPPLTLAMVYPFSCHNYELRYWLSAAGIHPDQDVRLIVLPPPLLVDALREGQIDGFCVGEPWNSLAVAVGAGCIVAPTTAIWRLSPEKVLGCRLEWAQRHPERVLGLVRVLYQSALWCDDPAHHEELAHILSEPKYVGAPATILMRGLANRLVVTPGEAPLATPNFYVAARHAATFPWTSHALWFYSQMVRWRQIQHAPDHLPMVRATYRPDLYRLALSSLGVELPLQDSKIEGHDTQGRFLASVNGSLQYGPDGFFDGRTFDPEIMSDYHAEPETSPDLGRTAKSITI